MSCTGKIRDWIIENGLISRGDHVTAAVSGGPDSMAMLSILDDLSDGLGFTLSAAYLDHRIRKETRRERLIVERWCARLGIPLVTGETDVPALAKRDDQLVALPPKPFERAGIDDRKLQKVLPAGWPAKRWLRRTS